RMNLAYMFIHTSRATVAQVLARDDFAQRFSEHQEIRIHEILYPLMQGLDSVQVQADVELGGSDQLFNNLVGRQFQQEENPRDPLAGQVVIVTPLLVGTDGTMKMSKSLGNYIAVTDPPSGPDGMFGKVMSLPDVLLEMYYTLLTDLPGADFKAQIAGKPRDAKIALAKHIISELHSPHAADAAEAEFVKVFSKKEAPDEMPEFTVGRGPHKIAHLLVTAGLASSSSEAIRKVREGAVSLDGQKLADIHSEVSVSAPTVIKLGRKFARVRP
ncbi:MAG: tyrosine--tRNA ligase, partial [Tepidisphaeraceae bacterium]